MTIFGPLLALLVVGTGTFAVVRAVARWVYRDEFDPDQRRFNGDWALWRMEMNRKESAE